MTNSAAAPMIIAVAPNGARKQQSEYPNLPITPAQLVAEAKACYQAGATMIHVHVRDEAEKHCLDVGRYREAFAAIREGVPEIFCQATSEAVGIFSRQAQIAMIKALKPQGVSIAVRELMPIGVANAEITDLFAFMTAENIAPQLIMYDRADRNRYQQLLNDGVLGEGSYPALFVLGRYSQGGVYHLTDIARFVDDLTGISTWMVCAFGRQEIQAVQLAALLGGHARVGFENNTLRADGSPANSNAEIVTDTVFHGTQLERCIADSQTTRQLLTLR